MRFPHGGGCQCGAVRYEISALPLVVYACHCIECQRQSGAAFALAAVIPGERFRITQGTPRMFARRTSPVKTMECWFCPDCGTRLYHVPGVRRRPQPFRPGGTGAGGRRRRIGHPRQRNRGETASRHDVVSHRVRPARQ